ncbi:MAG TPA: TetR/AcrR family transcriptional regulator [Candidatus Saccharimonadales bacterium]|nr:TetR/AcrR family transcriptional regulator [Candidatus Saccharimonadales bacterium]
MPGTAALVAHLPASPRERRKILTRAELLSAGRKLFSEKGLYESRIEDLTSTAGIAKGTLYRYFRDREHLIEAVVAEGLRELRQHIEVRLRGAGGREEVVRGLAEAHLSFLDQHRDLMRIFHQVRGLLTFDRARWKPLHALLEAHIAFLERALGLAVRGTGMRPADRRLLATLIFGGISGFGMARAALAPGERLCPDPGVVAGAFVGLYERIAARAAAVPPASRPARSRPPARPRSGARRP